MIKVDIIKDSSYIQIFGLVHERLGKLYSCNFTKCKSFVFLFISTICIKHTETCIIFFTENLISFITFQYRHLENSR